MLRLLKLKIQDPRFLYLNIKLLKAPTISIEGRTERNEVGSPQGSILSPVIANVYLHYVLDIWFSWLNAKQYRGSARTVRYADDAVFTFRNLVEAEKFRLQLVERLNNWGISINEGKTKAMVCGEREAARREALGLKMPSFTFLGFLHVWGKSLNRKRGVWFWRVKRRTCPLRFKKKLAEITTYIRANRHETDLIMLVKRVTQGYLNYFAINDNQKRVSQFVEEIKRILFNHLNRRGQKRSVNWDKSSNRALMR